MDYHALCHMQAWIIRQHGRETDSALHELHAMMLAEVNSDPEHYVSRGWWSVYDAAVERNSEWRGH